jgi:hypothetical protein
MCRSRSPIDERPASIAWVSESDSRVSLRHGLSVGAAVTAALLIGAAFGFAALTLFLGAQPETGTDAIGMAMISTFTMSAMCLLVGCLLAARVAGEWKRARRPAPAAWYPDTAGTSRKRYWDGTDWTDQFSD